MQIVLKGQVHGGKNNMGVTRAGIHYPKPAFVAWRNKTIAQILSQRPAGFKAIDSFDYHWVFSYVPEDNRRRDLPAILDSIWHCLEKAGIVKDDRFIMNIKFKLQMASKENCGMVIDFVKIKDEDEIRKVTVQEKRS